jgi:hypothetical protein
MKIKWKNVSENFSIKSIVLHKRGFHYYYPKNMGELKKL